MAKNEASCKQTENNEVTQLELLPSSNHNPFWSSSLFNEVYLQNDVPVKYKDLWSMDDAGPFNIFCNQFKILCEELKDADLDSWSERNTINRLVKPLLKLLGYSSGPSEPWAEDEPFTVQENGESKTYKPDLIIVNDPKELKYIEREKGDKKLTEARASVIVPVEAKYWGRIEDSKQTNDDTKRSDKKDSSDATRSLDFDEQCLKYMEILGKDFGILTDGKTWRLYNLELSSDSYRRHYQFNLGHLIRHVNAGLDKDAADNELFVDNAKYFYHFFSKASLYQSQGERRFVDELLEYSKKYANRIEEDLRVRFVNAMTIACNGFKRSANGDVNLDVVRSVSESHLFNILFIRYCEARGILPLKQSPQYRKISISNTLDKLEYFDPDKEDDNLNLPILKRMFSKDFTYDPKGTDLYERLLNLTKIIQEGSTSKFDTFEIKGFKESIFSSEEWAFAKSAKLTNRDMALILFELGYTDADVRGRKYQQVPYNFFSPRQLGSIYESFLEFKLEKASTDLIWKAQQWQEANINSEKIRHLNVPKVKKGNLFFSPDNKDRKATGSYYTPDYVVQYIVKNTIGPRIEKLSSKELLKFKAIDPAMGSGHFLSAVLNFLAKAYLAKIENETNDDIQLSFLEAKRIVLPSCIFGVDINPRAVKLAKMSLWLESASAGRSLERLDDQLRTADSLSDKFSWEKEFNEVFKAKGFDAVVGNPPYRRELDFKQLFDSIATTKIGRKYRSPRMDLWYYFVHRGLEILKPNGVLSFITNAYWIGGSGAEKLIEHIYQESHIDEFVVLGSLKIFDEVSGQHMIFRMTKNDSVEPTLVKVASSQKTKNAEDFFKNDLLFSRFEKEKSSLFKNGKIDLEESDDDLMALLDGNVQLKDLGLIRQGIAENPSTIGNKVNEKFKRKWTTGEGVFSLTPKEVKNIGLSAAEKKLLRPYHDLCDLGRFWAADVPSRLLVYSTKETCPNISEFPNLKSHLAKFKILMDGRRETMSGSNQWWHLHWPRDQKVWDSGRKILSVQMGRRPTFASISGPCYVPFSVNVFVPTNDIKLSIEYFEAILNSSLLWKWFQHNAKKRGVGLEINGNVLQRAPIKLLDLDVKAHKAIHDSIVDSIRKLKKKVKTLRDQEKSSDEIEQLIESEKSELDKLVMAAFAIGGKKPDESQRNAKPAALKLRNSRKAA